MKNCWPPAKVIRPPCAVSLSRPVVASVSSLRMMAKRASGRIVALKPLMSDPERVPSRLMLPVTLTRSKSAKPVPPSSMPRVAVG